MDIYSNEGKKAIIARFTPKTKLLRNSSLAFLFGGFICLIGELLRRLYTNILNDEEIALSCVSITHIFVASLLTALGVFDRIARYSGAGTLVPITGFSNAIASQAIDAKSEGAVLGVGAKIFTVAGPVILYGLCAGVIYGIIYFSISLIL